jgi:photosystem II stability/assembly factor-like uncharacterized protein
MKPVHFRALVVWTVCRAGSIGHCLILGKEVNVANRVESSGTPRKELLEEEKRPEPLRQEKPHWQLRRILADRMVGTADRARLLRDVAQAREQRARMHPVERASADPERPLRGPIELGEEVEGVAKASPASDPGKLPSFGGTGWFVQVHAEAGFSRTTLRFGLEPDAMRHLEPETIFVARWDEQDERLRLIPQSGFNAKKAYAYARVTRPGVYTAVGMPLDPRIRTTLHLMRAVSGWAGLEGRLDLLPKICQLILCNSAVERLVGEDRTDGFEGSGLSQGDFLGGFGGGNICEVCLGSKFGRVVELDILAVLDVPPYVLKPWPPPKFWPRPCPAWASIGPSNVPGRINAMAIHPTNGQTVYAGAAAGGVFKTSNAGASWRPLWSEQLSLAIGGLAVAPSNGDIVYAATGEWENNVGAANNHFPGVGVYRSTDGGSNWDLLAPIPSLNTAGLAIDPTDPNRVFVAGDTSLHRSTNGGASWDITPGNVRGIFDGVVSDVVIDPNDRNRLYIGVHNSGIWRSTDGGATWMQLTSGIATGAAANAPKIALGRNGASGTRFVAVKMAQQVYTSPDGGDMFTQQTDVDVPWAPFYPWANVIAVDLENEGVLFAGHASIYRSPDGGSTWNQVGGYGVPPVHPDQQALVFDPSNHDHVYLATDGGVYESTDNGVSWKAKSTGLVTTQCWTVGISQSPNLAYGITTQDNACYEHAAGDSFSEILGPEGGWIEYDPQDHQVIYADTWFAALQKSTNGGASWTGLGINTRDGNTEALAIARTNADLLLAVKSDGTVARSTTGGTGANPWTTVLSPGVTISAVQFAPSNDNHAFAGSSDGRIWHSADGGASWPQLVATPAGGTLPAALIHDIEVDWSDPLRIYVAFAALGVRQLWRGELGAGSSVTWFDVSGAQPAVSLPDLALTGLALDPDYEETIYVSSILGVYRSADGGESWHPFDEGLPNSWVSDLDIRKRDRALYASTMGRGLYRRYV